MKKKLLATVLTLALSLTIVKPSTIYAADNEKVTQAIEQRRRNHLIQIIL